MHARPNPLAMAMLMLMLMAGHEFDGDTGLRRIGRPAGFRTSPAASFSTRGD